ncbi:alpha glucuronidase [Hortaea werneckii]|nr:alpha glucuronidase [Hortaea werneckii]
MTGMLSKTALINLAYASLVAAENGLAAWLRYAPVSGFPGFARHANGIPEILVLNSSASDPVVTAGEEIKIGLKSMLGHSCRVSHGYQARGHGYGHHKHSSTSIVVATLDAYLEAYGTFVNGTPALREDGFWLDTTGETVQILGQTERGTLYGAFEYLSMIAQANFSVVAYANSPSAPVRWINQWDDMNGHIERGYGGSSLWFDDYEIRNDLTRAGQYARICASIGINGIVVNNVNANASTLEDENIAGLGRIADEFRPYGVQLGLSLNFASPNLTEPIIGTFDPLSRDVQDWWYNKTAKIYDAVPDFAGYLLKANSEGQPGPDTYNRSLSQGANMIADAIEPFGGILMFRSFLYDYATLDRDTWTDDRATEAYNYIQPLDGEFRENIIVQTKYGPLDFQVREAAHPLLGSLRRTNQAIELQVTPEYLGQNDHLVYLAPLWKTILDFDFRADGKQSLVRDILSGERFSRPLSGYVGVAGVGTNLTWMGSNMALSNLYAFGRLAWNPTQDSDALARDWARLTFSNDERVVDTLTKMCMLSWPAYENYTGNLGMLTLADVSINTHFGPNPESSEIDPWGFWTRAGPDSIGMDRTVCNGTGPGTGLTGQYPPEVFAMYENLETTPDELVLFFHHVPWTYQLRQSGVTVIQHIYDAHYAGARTAHDLLAMFRSLRGLIDEERWNAILFERVFQAGHAVVWRDAVTKYFYNISQIADDFGRVANYPHRIEAENMDLDGYEIYDVSPWYTASGAQCVVTSSNRSVGSASTKLEVNSGIYDVVMHYHDIVGGPSRYELFLNDAKIGQFLGNINDGLLGHDVPIFLDGNTATNQVLYGVEVRKGDVLTVLGHPTNDEPASIDYLEFTDHEGSTSGKSSTPDTL